MTKDLVFILTNSNCKKTLKVFIKRIKMLGVDRLGACVYKKCQANSNHISRDKDRYLVKLTPKDPNESKQTDGGEQGKLYDAVLEFEGCILVFEVKTDSSLDSGQIQRYERDLTPKKSIDLTWDDIYAILKEAEKQSNNDAEKLLVKEYLELIRVMDLTKTFDGFKGVTPQEHSAELRNLLAQLKEKKVIESYNLRKKSKDPWYWASFGKNKDDGPHITLYRNNESLQCVLTDLVLTKNKYCGEVAKVLNKISQWNNSEFGQHKYGRTFAFMVNDYRNYTGSRQGSDYTEASVFVRLDSRPNGEQRNPEEISNVISKAFNILVKDFKAKNKQVQIGFYWSLNYNSRKRDEKANWEDSEYSYKQVKKAILQLRSLYYALKTKEKKNA